MLFTSVSSVCIYYQACYPVPLSMANIVRGNVCIHHQACYPVPFSMANSVRGNVFIYYQACYPVPLSMADIVRGNVCFSVRPTTVPLIMVLCTLVAVVHLLDKHAWFSWAAEALRHH